MEDNNRILRDMIGCLEILAAILPYRDGRTAFGKVTPALRDAGRQALRDLQLIDYDTLFATIRKYVE